MKEDRSFPTPFTTASKLNDAVREIKISGVSSLSPPDQVALIFIRLGIQRESSRVVSVPEWDPHNTAHEEEEPSNLMCVHGSVYAEQRLNHCETGSCGTLWGKLVFCVCAWGGVAPLQGEPGRPEADTRSLPQYISTVFFRQGFPLNVGLAVSASWPAGQWTPVSTCILPMHCWGGYDGAGWSKLHGAISPAAHLLVIFITGQKLISKTLSDEQSCNLSSSFPLLEYRQPLNLGTWG